MQRFFFGFKPGDACIYNRFQLPTNFLHNQMREEGIELLLLDRIPQDGSRFDAYFMHGVIPAETFPHIGSWLNDKSKFIYSVDDAYREVPRWNPAYPQKKDLGGVAIAEKIASHILCSTVPLANHIDYVTQTRKTIVCPNLIDMRKYRPRHKEKKQDDVVRILWFGSTTHLGDMEPIVDKLIQVMLERKGKVGIISFGDCHPRLRQYLDSGVLEVPHVPLSQYHEVLNSIDADIAICPLVESLFNKSKSALKMWESFGSGLATLVAEFPESPYLIPTWGERGAYGTHLGYSDPEDFYDGLSALIDDEKDRQQMASAGYEYVKKHYSWQSESARQPWVDFFRKVANS